MEENKSDESNALWEAYKDLALIEDHEATEEKAVKDEQLPMDKEGTLKLLGDESEDEEMGLEQRPITVCYRGSSIPKSFTKLKLY